jgi:Transglycosylase
MRNAATNKARPRRRLWRVAAAAVVLALLVLAGHAAVERYARAKIEAELEKALPRLEQRTGLALAVGGVRIGLDGGGALTGVRAADPATPNQPFFTAERVDILYDLDLKKQQIEVTGLRAIKPRLTVRIDADGKPNLPAALWAELRGNPTTETKLEGGAAGELLGGHVLLPSTLPIEFRDGGLEVTDAGRWARQPATLLALVGATGEVAIDLRNKAVVADGRAAQPGGGGLEIKAELTRDRQRVVLKLNGFRLQGQSAMLPKAMRFGKKSAVTGSVAVERKAGDPELTVELDGNLRGLEVEHRRLAQLPILDIRVGLTSELRVDPAARRVRTKSAEVRFGDAKVFLYDAELAAANVDTFLLRTELSTAGLAVQDLLDGLPENLVPALQGAVVEGRIDLTASLLVDMKNVSASHVEVEGGVTGLRAVTVPPPVDVRRISSPAYRHVIVRRGIYKREIAVGPGNDNFVPLDAVGSYLRGAVLTCEDGSFFRHNGFMLRHINDSLRRNLRERRFVRGASTVSMQLTKNLFLSHEKTVSRKLQEVMLTWWMEQEVDKKRMLEVYLNIIEWGPEIYGVGPASRHYFHRHPSKLKPIQAAWMASIISNPVRYHYMKARGEVSPGWRTTLAFIMGKLRDRGTITQEDLDQAAEDNFSVPFGSTDLDKEKEAAGAPGEGPQPTISPAGL